MTIIILYLKISSKKIIIPTISIIKIKKTI